MHCTVPASYLGSVLNSLLNSDFLPSVRRRCAFGKQCQGGEQGRAKKCYHRVKAEDAYLCIGLWPSAIMRPINSIWHGQAKLLGYDIFLCCTTPSYHSQLLSSHCHTMLFQSSFLSQFLIFLCSSTYLTEPRRSLQPKGTQ